MDTRGHSLYEGLDIHPEYDAIRTLTVVSDDEWEGNIPCLKLRPRLLQLHTNRFYAISYTWGRAEPTHEVLINGKSVFVTGNVYLLILYWEDLKAKDHDVNELWIDAICINQADIEERNKQVRLMGQIYSVSKGTIIWLDQNSVYPPIAPTIARMMRHFDRSITKLWEIAGTSTDNGLAFGLPLPILRAIIKEIWRIFGHPYWKRLWVVQEVVLARGVLLVLHNTLVRLDSWAKVLHVEQRVYESLPPSEQAEFGEPHANMRHLRLLLHYRDMPQARSLTGLLKTCREHLCSSPKDMIYGLLGLADDGDNMPIDYHKSNTELFFDAFEITYPAEEPTQQISSIARLLQVLRISLTQVLEHILTAQDDKKAFLLRRVYPLKVMKYYVKDISRLANSSALYQTDQDAESAKMWRWTTLDPSLGHSIWVTENVDGNFSTLCVEKIRDPIANATGIGGEIMEAHCSAWEILLLFASSDSQDVPILSTDRVLAQSFMRYVSSVEGAEAISALSALSQWSSGHDLQQRFMFSPLSRADVEDVLSAPLTEQATALAIINNSSISRGEKLRKRIEYWNKARAGRMIDDLHSLTLKEFNRTYCTGRDSD